MGWLFNRRKKVEYIEQEIYGIEIETRCPDYDDCDRKTRMAKWKSREELGCYLHGFFIGHYRNVVEKTEDSKDYSRENERFFEDIRFDIIANITKGLPCFPSFDMESGPCGSIVIESFKLEKESLIYSKDYKEYIGVKSFTRELYDKFLESAQRKHYDVDYGIYFPLLTKEEIENDKYYESNYTDIENCYMLISIGLCPGGMSFRYNPDTKGFREEEIFERIREVVEDKYHLQLVINR